MKAKLGWLVCVALASSLGCGEEKSAEEAFVDSYCAEVSRCCAQAYLPTDGRGCREVWALAALGGTYSPQSGDACLAEVRSQAGAGTFCKNVSEGTPSACDVVYGASSGMKQPGESCALDSDCAGSSDGDVICASANIQGSFVSKCQVLVAGKSGDSPCAGTQDGSDFEPYSDPNAFEMPSQAYVCNFADGVQCRLGTCAALVAMGGACNISPDCVRDAYCKSNACTARVATGSTCTGSDTAECIDGNYCSSGSKLCTGKVANGGACSGSTMCQSGYCLNTVCAEDYSGLTFICGS